jgi:glycosyltransferase involved in cell wall biosynthesis
MIAAIERRAGLLRRERIDLLHLNNSPIPTAEDWLPAARLSATPVVTHCRAHVRPSIRGLRGWLARRFDRVISISRTVSESLRAAGVPEERIAQVYDGVDARRLLESVRRSPADVRRDLGIPADALLVLMVGHLRSWKGQHVLLDALDALDAEELSRLRVLFAGDVDPIEIAYAERPGPGLAEAALQPR